MPVFDFSNSKTEKKDPECTYTTFQSNEKVPSPEKPILIIENKSRQWKHHSCGVFSNPNQKSSFEFKEEDGVFPADILKIDARFVSLVKWLGENHISVRLSGQNTEDGYAIYKIRETAFGGAGKLSAEDGFLQFMIERLLASNAPTELPDGDEEDEDGDDMKLTSIQSITDFMTCAGRTMPDNIRLWARRNLAVAKSHEVSQEERRHAQRALSIMMNIQWKNNYFESIDPVEARRILDEELYGMEKVKQRIIETIIQINRTHTLPAYGLLLVGPAGTGKSQIAYAVARILKLPWTTLDMSSINDPEQLTGSSRVYANVPFYRKRFDESGIKPGDIKSLADLKNLPFTEKQDLRNYYPFGLFAVPRDNIVRLHASSGTTGKAVVVGYTARDLHNWAELAGRSLSAAGVNQTDIVHVAYGYGLFTGGLGAHGGAERIGATVVPASGGATRRQAYLLRDFGATALCCTPSYALHLWEAGQEVGIDFRDLPLRTGVFGAEPWTEEMRQDIERKMGINALNIYGLSEVMGPGVAMECLESKCGMHLWEDHFLPEIIDPVTGEQLPEGEVGELVITTLTKEGIPLIRYRTRDLTSLDYTPCRCGRTHVRLTRIRGRSDDMLIIRGVNVFPQQIEALLMENQNLSPNYQIIVDRVNNLDTLEVQVEMNETLFADEIRKLQSLESSIQKSIKEFLGVTTKVRLMEPHSIQRSEGKAKRIIDKRPTE